LGPGGGDGGQLLLNFLVGELGKKPPPKLKDECSNTFLRTVRKIRYKIKKKRNVYFSSLIMKVPDHVCVLG
jgi:hypothetical protein